MLGIVYIVGCFVVLFFNLISRGCRVRDRKEVQIINLIKKKQSQISNCKEYKVSKLGFLTF